ncbi:hypothetical protein ABEB36_005507 [Hypothenemus hampei]|uniref:Uncharacterized protein n=1 Tax=Hypothenemus hampei TaxID=57062 RepID=A0ABD1EYG1_HYPHA
MAHLKHLILIVFTCEVVNAIYDYKQLNIYDTSHELLSRNKRWLVWKEGVNWVSIIFGIGIPFEIDEQNIVLGLAAKAYYQLPNNSTYYTHPTLNFERKTRSTSRWLIYELIEHYLERYHYPDGKACLLKSICQLSSIKLEERSGLLAEIVQHILTPSTTREEIEDHGNYAYHVAEKLGKEIGNCEHIYPECPMDPLQQFSRLMTIGTYLD